MKKLPLPTQDSITLWTDVVNNKHLEARQKLLLKKNLVQERYALYSSQIHDLDQLSALDWENDLETRALLISCFGNNVNFVSAKKAIFSNVSKCPYCTINRPNTLDHYFDKADYPEYAVYLPNLIPCCSECNSQKGTALFDPYHKRKYIHFYYDNIPDYQFLFVHLSFKPQEAIPKVELSLNFQDDTPNTVRIANHFLELNLLKKIKEQINDKLPTIITEISTYHENPNFDAKKIINIRYASLVSTHGVNYWEACMLNGILSSSDFWEKYA